MAADLGLASLSQLQKLAQSQVQLIQAQPLPPPDSASTVMWNPRNTAAAEEDDDDSWEIKAFEEDTSNATWPPRSYTCTFCRREFRSAQALGGHMNVHRRERARLQLTSNMGPHTTMMPSTSTMMSSTHCVLYSLPNPNGGPTFSPAKTKPNGGAISPFATNNFPATPQCRIMSSIDPSVSNDVTNNKNYYNGTQKREAAIVEELDLELRLGCSSSSSSPSP